VPLNGGPARTIVRDVSKVYDAPAISPDGKLVAFLSAKGRIETVLLASGKRSVVVEGPLSSGVGGLAWSPDGKELAYLVPSEDGSSSLYVVKADGSDRKRISEPGESVNSFDWRPDAAAVAR
jgi:Tol biopolymer transport system component